MNRLVKTIWSRKGITAWEDDTNLYISVVFTWEIKKAKEIRDKAKTNKNILIGGPAISLTQNIRYDDYYINALSKFNENACFTTRGCVRNCGFCAVPKIEGSFRELKDFTPKPIICDNNFLASSRKHFDKVISMISNLKSIDFNQGLDCRLINKYHINKLRNLDLRYIRFAWDSVNEESKVMNAIKLCLDNGIPKNKISVYVLIGFNDTPEDAFYRLDKLKNMKIFPYPMRYQPLYCLEKNKHIGTGWDNEQLKKMVKYYSNLRITSKIPYDEFIINKR